MSGCRNAGGDGKYVVVDFIVSEPEDTRARTHQDIFAIAVSVELFVMDRAVNDLLTAELVAFEARST